MKRSTKIRFITARVSMLFYRAALPLSPKTLGYVAGLLRRHRAVIGSCWRKLNPGQQALLVLAYLLIRRDVRRARGRVRGRDPGRLAVRHRNRGPAGRPLAEAGPGAGSGEGRRVRLPGH
jgi:hypothetical protein